MAVFTLESKVGVAKGTEVLITDHMMVELRRANVFSRVVSPNEIAALMPPEQANFLVRCASDECALVDNEIAGVLGVSHILVGNVGKLGDSYLVNLRLLDVRSSVLVASVSERARAASDEGLLDAVKPAVATLLKEAGLQPEQAAAPTSTAGGGPRIPLLVTGAAVGAGAVVVALAGAASGASALGLLAWDVGGGWRPGGVHTVTALQGAAGNLAAAAGAVLLVLALGGVTATVALLLAGVFT